MSNFKFNGNENIPTALSRLRQFNARANSSTLNLGIGRPFEDTPSILRELAIDVIKFSVLDYSDNEGTPGLRKNISQFFATDANHFLITHGAQEALFIAVMGLLEAGDELLIPDPGFLAYQTLGEMHALEVKTYKMKNHNHQFIYDVDEILKQVTRKTKMVLISKVANPTGSDLSLDDLGKLAVELKKRGIILLSDEVYGELHFKEKYDPLFKLSSNIVTVNSLSKSHALTGWRIGYVGCTHEGMMKKMLVAHQYIATCAARISQNVAEKLFANPQMYESIAKKYRDYYQKTMTDFLSVLPKDIAGAVPCGAFYAFLPIPKNFSSGEEFCETLLTEQNILAVPGGFFGSQGEQYYRLALSVKPEINVKEIALKFKNYYK